MYKWLLGYSSPGILDVVAKVIIGDTNTKIVEMKNYNTGTTAEHMYVQQKETFEFVPCDVYTNMDRYFPYCVINYYANERIAIDKLPPFVLFKLNKNQVTLYDDSNVPESYLIFDRLLSDKKCYSIYKFSVIPSEHYWTYFFSLDGEMIDQKCFKFSDSSSKFKCAPKQKNEFECTIS